MLKVNNRIYNNIKIVITIKCNSMVPNVKVGECTTQK